MDSCERSLTTNNKSRQEAREFAFAKEVLLDATNLATKFNDVKSLESIQSAAGSIAKALIMICGEDDNSYMHKFLRSASFQTISPGRGTSGSFIRSDKPYQQYGYVVQDLPMFPQSALGSRVKLKKWLNTEAFVAIAVHGPNVLMDWYEIKHGSPEKESVVTRVPQGILVSSCPVFYRITYLDLLRGVRNALVHGARPPARSNTPHNLIGLLSTIGPIEIKMYFCQLVTMLGIIARSAILTSSPMLPKINFSYDPDNKFFGTTQEMPTGIILISGSRNLFWEPTTTNGAKRYSAVFPLDKSVWHCPPLKTVDASDDRKAVMQVPVLIQYNDSPEAIISLTTRTEIGIMPLLSTEKEGSYELTIDNNNPGRLDSQFQLVNIST